MTNANAKSCFWIIVENSDPESFRGTLETLFETTENITYICGQLEQGTNRHFQGYTQLKRAQAKSWLINNISRTAHYEIQYKKATADNGRHYASKPHEGCECKECREERANPTAIEDTFVEYGAIRDKGQGAGARTDLYKLRDSVKEGKKEREIIEDDELVVTYATHTKFHDRVKMLYRPPHLERVELRLYVGDTGTGKTTRAFTIDEDYYDVPISNGTLWFDGYDQNNVLIFDDFAGRVDHQTLVSTLKLFDRYVRRIPVKGSYTWLRSPIVVVTSNFHPRAWYDWNEREKSYAALCRRFTQVVVFERVDGEDHIEEYNTREEIEDYFNDRNQWPIQYPNREPITGRVGFEDYD